MRCNFIAIKHSICSPSPGMFINEIWAKVKFVHRRRHSLSAGENERESEEGRKTVDNVNRSRKTNSKSKMAPQNFACCCGVASRFLAAPKTLTMRICCRLLQKFKYTDKREGKKTAEESRVAEANPAKPSGVLSFACPQRDAARDDSNNCSGSCTQLQVLVRVLVRVSVGPLNSLDSYNCTLLTFRRDCPRTVFKLWEFFGRQFAAVAKQDSSSWRRLNWVSSQLSICQIYLI